jgi:NitT/TauT family transport system ATP-binding protein
LLQLWESDRKTVLFITHGLDEAIRLADRVVVMTSPPGRTKAIIPVDIPRPRQVFDMPSNPEYLRLHAARHCSPLPRAKVLVHDER